MLTHNFWEDRRPGSIEQHFILIGIELAYRKAATRCEAAMMIMRPPQQGQE